MIELETRPDGGLARDLPLLRRRRTTGLAGGTTVAALAGLAQGTAELAMTLASRMANSGFVRDDIRRSFGAAAGVARGVPLTVRLRVVSANSGQPIAGQAIYLWHADRQGAYSLCSPGLTGENYLRGVQVSDVGGWAQFRSTFPGSTAHRWPHLNVEVYPSLAAATDATSRRYDGRLTLPADACTAVFARPDYAASRASLTANLAEDGQELAMASVTGTVDRGFTAVRTIAI